MFIDVSSASGNNGSKSRVRRSGLVEVRRWIEPRAFYTGERSHLTCMTPPPTSFTFQKALSSPNILAPQSMTTASSSVHAGLANHCSYAVSFYIQLKLAQRTLKPGFDVLEDRRSPRMPSNVHAVGKYAKKEGCCQCVKPIQVGVEFKVQHIC